MLGAPNRGTTPRTALTSHRTLGSSLYLSHPQKTSSPQIWISLQQLFSTEGNFFFYKRYLEIFSHHIRWCRRMGATSWRPWVSLGVRDAAGHPAMYWKAPLQRVIPTEAEKPCSRGQGGNRHCEYQVWHQGVVEFIANCRVYAVSKYNSYKVSVNLCRLKRTHR